MNLLHFIQAPIENKQTNKKTRNFESKCIHFINLFASGIFSH